MRHCNPIFADRRNICVSKRSLQYAELLLQSLGQPELIGTHTYYIIADQVYYAMISERNILLGIVRSPLLESVQELLCKR
jgi:hypothetical protein